MLNFPKFLTNLSDTAARKTDAGDPVKIELLGCKREKPPKGWQTNFALGDVLLTINVPSDAFGHADATFLLEALANAIRNDPPDQLALPGMTKADPRFAGPIGKQLGLPDPGAPRADPPPLAPPPAPTTRAELGKLTPPRGRKPKAGYCRFLVVGSNPKTEVVLDAEGLVAKWEHSGEPNDTYTAEEFLGSWSPGETKTVAECTRRTYAGHLVTLQRALWLADAQYAPGEGLWVHVQALGRNPDSLGKEPLTPAAPPAAGARLICCICGHPMRPAQPTKPKPVKCIDCWEDGKGPTISDAEVGELLDTEPPAAGAEHPPESEPPRPGDHQQTGGAIDSTQPFEHCCSCLYFDEGDGCEHPDHPPTYFLRPCPDRRPRG